MSASSLAAVVGWLMIAWRLLPVKLSSPETRYSFATLLCFTLAASLDSPLIASWIDQFTRLPSLSKVLEYSFAIAAASVWALTCLSLDGLLAGRRWLLALAPVSLLAMLLIWGLGIISSQSPRTDFFQTDYSLTIVLIIHTYAFAIVAGIAIPALGHSLDREKESLPLRLRLIMIFTTQTILAVWLASRVALTLFLLLGLLPRTYQFSFVQTLIILMIIAYTGSLLPARAYIYLAHTIRYLQYLQQLIRIRKLEISTARLLGFHPHSISAYEALRVPDYVLYTLVIAILDRRKSLCASGRPSAQRLGVKLGEIAETALKYTDLVKHLEKVELKL